MSIHNSVTIIIATSIYNNSTSVIYIERKCHLGVVEVTCWEGD